MKTMRTFGFSAVATAVIMAAVAFGMGPAGLASAAILTVLEVTFSFDNAVVNAKLLGFMSSWWQRFFMTVGIIVAVFVVRFALPILIVSLTSGLGFGDVVTLAVQDPVRYGEELAQAGPAIDSFGGIFLLMIAAAFFLDSAKDLHWLKTIEARLVRVGRLDNVGIFAIALIAVTVIATMPGDVHEHFIVALAAMAAMALHIGLDVFAAAMDGGEEEDEKEDEKEAAFKPLSQRESNVLEQQTTVTASKVKVLVGAAAAFMFLRLEILDASFSFDGVIGAFALSNNVFIIMAGLGAGALWVRSLTVHLVRTGTLAKYQYLEHGAHWAIGALGIMMLLKLYRVELPEWVVGSTGLVFIAWAVSSSIRRRAAESVAV